MELKLGDTVLCVVDESKSRTIIEQFIRPGKVTELGYFDRHAGEFAELAIWIMVPIREADDPQLSWPNRPE